jgi:hypothetical protein
MILSNSLLETQCQAGDCFALLQEISPDLNTVPNDSFKLFTAVYKFVSTTLHCGCRHQTPCGPWRSRRYSAAAPGVGFKSARRRSSERIAEGTGDQTEGEKGKGANKSRSPTRSRSVESRAEGNQLGNPENFSQVYLAKGSILFG